MEKLKSSEKIKEIVGQKSNLIIYGAGGVGKVLLARLLQEYPDMTPYIAVTDRNSSPYYLLGRKVVCIEELLWLADKCKVIIATLEKTQKSISDHLHNLGFHDVCGMCDVFYEQLKKEDVEQYQDDKLFYFNRCVDPCIKNMLDICKEYQIESAEKCVKNIVEKMETNKICFSRLVVVLGSKCSLRCRDCNNLMPYFNPQKELEYQKIINSLEVLSSKVDAILKCELIGGEPFLSENLNVILDFVLKKENIYQVEITTNGMILPKQEQIAMLQNNKVKVRISDYGDVVDKRKIVTYLDKYNVSYEVLAIEKWTEGGGTNKRGRDAKELQDVYHNCYAGYFCKTLYEDKLFACPRASSLWALGYLDEQDFVTVEEKTSTEALEEFLLRPYALACDFCDRAAERTYVEPAIQLKD